MDDRHIFSFERPEDNAGYLLWQVSMLWQLKMKKALDKLGITLTQFALLAALHWLTRNGDIVTQKDLAQHAKTDKMTTSKVLRTLQKNGLVTRTEHERDTRAKIIALTEAGLQVLTAANVAVEATDQRFFGVLRAETGAYARLMEVLLEENR
jgi:DNA-binding MarR family transcriptional regulator